MPTIVDMFGARPIEQRPKLHHDMERATEQLQNQFPDKMAGFVMLAVDDEGTWNVRFSCRADGVIGRRILAALAPEAMREMMVVDACISDRMAEIF